MATSLPEKVDAALVALGATDRTIHDGLWKWHCHSLRHNQRACAIERYLCDATNVPWYVIGEYAVKRYSHGLYSVRLPYAIRQYVASFTSASRPFPQPTTH